jgi:hypothetical protein
VNEVTGKTMPGVNYAARTRRYARAVIRSFYLYYQEMYGRPLYNRFPHPWPADADGDLDVSTVQSNRRRTDAAHRRRLRNDLQERQRDVVDRPSQQDFFVHNG